MEQLFYIGYKIPRAKRKAPTRTGAIANRRYKAFIGKK